MTTLTKGHATEFRYRGAVSSLFRSTAREVLLSGPAGTGKSLGCLHKLHRAAHQHPGMRGLILRKTRASLQQTALVTYEKQVMQDGDRVPFYTPRGAYRYPNGSEVVIGGLDKDTKIMSAEYDLIYIQEATEIAIGDWEAALTRLRNNVMPYQQLIADCNPSAPTHWLKHRADSGLTQMYYSVHEDNPWLWDGNNWTAEGQSYLGTLDSLTGVRHERLRLGRWAAAEGLIYESWEPAVHIVDSAPIPPEWPRYLAIDFGYKNPFVCQWWAQSPDDELYLYRELVAAEQLVEDLAREVVVLSADEPRPRTVICDHDAEDRATFERHSGMATEAAYKAVPQGVQEVQLRLRPRGNGRRGMYVLRDALVRRDPKLDAQHKPQGFAEEVDGYVWEQTTNRAPKEEPLKRDDHSMDAARYLAAYFVERVAANVRFI